MQGSMFQFVWGFDDFWIPSQFLGINSNPEHSESPMIIFTNNTS